MKYYEQCIGCVPHYETDDGWEHNEDWWDKFDEWREGEYESFVEGYADWIVGRGINRVMARKIKSKIADNSGWTDPSKKKKVRKKRKPMTEEQKQAAAERLEKKKQERARAAKNPNYGQSGIHESLRDLQMMHPSIQRK